MKREIWVCPRCKKRTNEVPALSRADGKTNICPACGQDEAIEAYRRAMGTTWEERAQFYIENNDTIGLVTDPLLVSNEEYILWLAKNSPDAKKMIIENCKNEKLLEKLLKIEEGKVNE